MTSLSLFYALPAALFLVLALLWAAGRRMPRVFAVLPVLACYAATAFLLVMGGCHRVAHVALEGLEADLSDREGNLRPVVLGGEAGPGLPQGIGIPGYPADALRVNLQGNDLVLSPGTGYERGLLVRCDGELIPLEPGGLPRLLPLESGDRIRLEKSAGGAVLALWQLGTGRYDLTPESGAGWRWIGSSGTGVAELDGLAPQILGVRAAGGMLHLKRGAGLVEPLGIQVNGMRVDFGGREEVPVAWQPGITHLALVHTDPAAGTAVLEESGWMHARAALAWESVEKAQPAAYTFEVEADRLYMVGGSLRDDFFVQGLHSGVLHLSVSAEGEMVLELTRAGKEAVEKGLLSGTYPQHNRDLRKGVRVGLPGAPASGAFLLVEKLGGTPPVPAPAEGTVAAEGAEDDTTDVSLATTPAAPIRWRCAWLPETTARLELANRRITLPFLNYSVALGTRRPWMQQVFPLSHVTARESTLRSVVVYDPVPDAPFNVAHLLQLDPGVVVERGGQPLAASTVKTGLLPRGGKVEFLQLLADEDEAGHGTAFGQPWRPAAVREEQRVSLRRSFSEITLEKQLRGAQGRQVPVLHVKFEKPFVRAIPMDEIKADLKARADGPVSVKFGLNDRSGFSTLPHQVTFPGLSRWFDGANADVELNWLSLTAQDDYRKQTVDYGEPLLIGGDRRLMLRVTKHTLPWSLVVLTGFMGLVATVLCWWRAGSFAWTALLFGAAFLTCSRVLFGQAALVNLPFNPEVLTTAKAALVVVPLLLAVWAALSRKLLPGRIEAMLRGFESWAGYGKIAAVSVLLLLMRAGLLAAGLKEAVPLFGGVRFALSIIFVPLNLALCALAFFVLWREKERAGWLGWRVAAPFLACMAVMVGCQFISSFLVSDIGILLYFIPQALVLAVFGAVAAWEGVLRVLREQTDDTSSKNWRQITAALLRPLALGLLLLLPALLIASVFIRPALVVDHIPQLRERMAGEEDLLTDSTLLRVLQFVDKDYLVNLGTDTAERIAQDHAIMESYAHRGLLGEGYLQVDVLPAKAVTALNDNVSAVFILAQFGVCGALAVLLAYAAITLSAAGGVARSHGFTGWLGLMAGLAFCLISIYMVAANVGLLPFTGRNMYLLGLNSWSDLVESFLLLALIVLGRTRTEFHEQAVLRGIVTSDG